MIKYTKTSIGINKFLLEITTHLNNSTKIEYEVPQDLSDRICYTAIAPSPVMFGCLKDRETAICNYKEYKILNPTNIQDGVNVFVYEYFNHDNNVVKMALKDKIEDHNIYRVNVDLVEPSGKYKRIYSIDAYTGQIVSKE